MGDRIPQMAIGATICFMLLTIVFTVTSCVKDPEFQRHASFRTCLRTEQLPEQCAAYLIQPPTPEPLR